MCLVGFSNTEKYRKIFFSGSFDIFTNSFDVWVGARHSTVRKGRFFKFPSPKVPRRVPIFHRFAFQKPKIVPKRLYYNTYKFFLVMKLFCKPFAVFFPGFFWVNTWASVLTFNIPQKIIVSASHYLKTQAIIDVNIIRNCRTHPRQTYF